MLRELLTKEQAEGKGDQETDGPPVSNHQIDHVSGQKDREDEDFVPVSHQDVDYDDMEDVDSDQSHDVEELTSSPPSAGLQLHRMAASNYLDQDDDSEHSFLSPLMGHLQGRLNRSRSAPNKFDPLHPYTSPLSLSDVDECVRVESEAFPEHERCTKEKFMYRLTKCPELSLAIFSRPSGSQMAKAAGAEAKASKPPQRSQAAKSKTDKLKAATAEDGKVELIGFIVSTRTPAPCVTDASMDYPKAWQTSSTLPTPTSEDEEPAGHQDQGSTICIHSLAVGKAHQRKGLGTVLLKSYIQRIKESRIADRIALIAHGHLIQFYETHGFVDMGESACTFGGGNWRNMVLEFGDEYED